MITAELISIGDELLIGQVVNTNATFLSKALNAFGISVARVTTVGDSERAILKAFERAWWEMDVVIVTGGLGPTHDDISKDAVAKFFGKDLKLDRSILDDVRKRFESFGYKQMPEANVSQAMVPEDFIALKNEAGTAPGLLYTEGKKAFAILPGVPFEMEWIVSNGLMSSLKGVYNGEIEAIRHRTLLTTGIGESKLAELLGEIGDLLEEHATLAFLPKSTGVRLRISVHEKKPKDADEKLARVEQRIRDRAGKYIYGTDEESIQAHVVRLLKEQNVTLSVAESCTGGMISSWITDIPGSSTVFIGGIVSYGNNVKSKELGVLPEVIDGYGAVSEPAAKAMAEGVLKRLESTYALSVTGIAGPDGGTEEKPLGTTWIALAEKGKPTYAQKFQFPGDRTVNRERAASSALEMLRRRLLGMDASGN